MKKFGIILLLFLMCLPIIVFGTTGIFWDDARSVEYYAYVSNKDGSNASCYTLNSEEEPSIFVPYLSKIKVSDEFFINGKMYASFTYKDTTCDIFLDDISIANGNELELEYDSFNRVIYKDIYLYEGPAYAYKKIIKVPAWTKLKITYSNDMWGYTEYGGKTGWINITSYWSADFSSDYSGSLNNIRLNYILNNDLQLVSSPFNNDKVTGMIPKGTELKVQYYLSSYNGISYYVEYGDVKGWINKVDDYVGRTAEIYDENGFEVLAMKGGSIFSLKNLDIYSDVNKTSVIGSVPKHTAVALNYHVFNKNNSSDYLNINYNGISGWVIDEDTAEKREDDILKNYPESHAVVMYESYVLSKDLSVKNISTNEEENIKKGEIVYVGNIECEGEECGTSYLYYNSNDYYYEEFDGEYFNDFQEEPEPSEPNEKGVDKKFVFDVNVPKEILNAKIFGVDYFLEDAIVTESDDVVTTIPDEVISTKQDDVKNNIFASIPMYYYCVILLLIVVVIVIIVGKSKNKNKNIERDGEVMNLNNEIKTDVEVNNVSTETVSQDKNDSNEAQL